MDVKFIDNSLALQSLRDSDFDVYSAYGEVIDNSIQAEASWIKIHFDMTRTTSKRPYSIINEVIFSDNGKGMNKEVLQRCMQMGFSSRYNDRNGIGRFGVGMTLASINQCKRVEIFSRQQEGEWLWTYVDLDEIMQRTAEGIPEPIVKKLPEEYEKLASEESGTIVIWKKYDRQPISGNKIVDEMHVWAGRTYRYFIWDNVDIYINASKVKAIDPLYVHTEKTNFPDDPKAEELTPIEFNWKVSKIDKAENSPDEAPITIRLSLLPEELRAYRGAGGSEETKKRYIDRNEGVSIIRNKREVFYGHIPYFTPKFEEIDRWWGCEISFNAVLDREFTVKNIKRGALPNSELREVIQSKINPTRNSVIERVRDFWAKAKLKAEEEEKKNELTTGHEEAERIAKNTITVKNVIDTGKNVKEEADRFVQEIMAEDYDETLKKRWATKFADQPFTIKDDQWGGSGFFETNHLGGNDVLLYNMRHPFFVELGNIIREIESRSPDNELYRELKTLIDLLIISYSKSEAMFNADDKLSASDFIEAQRSNWGEYLKRYLTTWINHRQG